MVTEVEAGARVWRSPLCLLPRLQDMQADRDGLSAQGFSKPQEAMP